jgi:hypothetical protein
MEASSFAYVAPKRARRKLKFTGLVISWLAIAGIAFAAWTVTSSNFHGYAKAGALVAPTSVNISGTVAGDLFPGVAGSLKFQVVNPNQTSLKLTGYTVNTVDVTGVGCNSADISVPNKSGLTGLTVPANTGPSGALVEVQNAITLNANAPTECQNAVFDVTTTATFST